MVGISLFGRSGEQHSFILRPINQAWKQPMMDDGTPRNRPSHDGLVVNVGSIKARRGSNYELDGGEYAILVSCHCSHTGNSLFLILCFYKETSRTVFIDNPHAEYDRCWVF